MRTSPHRIRAFLAALTAVVVTATGMVVGPLSPAAQAYSVLDQSSTDLVTPGSHAVVREGGGPVRQTFTAGRTGAIDRLSIAFNPNSAQSEMRAEIVALADGSFTGAQTVGYATFPAVPAGVSQDPFRTVMLDQKAPVTEGTQYGIVLTSPGIVCVSVATGYEGGQLVSAANDRDLGFQTYVNESVWAPILSVGDLRLTFGQHSSVGYSALGMPVPEMTIEGALPPGMTLVDSTNYLYIYGTPTQVGTYPITLTASNQIGPPVSRTVTLTVTALTPSRPLEFEVKSLPDGKITASWKPPASDGGSPIIEYHFSVHGALQCTTAQVSCTIEGTSLLHPGFTYSAHVYASNHVGIGDVEFTNFTYTTAPSVVRDLSATPDANQVDLVWNVPASNGGSAITQYAVERRQPGDEWERIGEYSAASRQLTVAGLDNGIGYDFRIAAGNDPQGLGPWTEISATPATVPGAPIISVAPGNGLADVSWQTPSDGGSPIDEYQIRHRELDSDYSPVGEWELTGDLDPGTPVFQIPDLRNGTAYEFQVRAVNAIGAGAWSLGRDGIPTGPPSAPRLDLVLVGDSVAHVYWTPPSSDGGEPITDYQVEQRVSDGGNDAWSLSDADVDLDRGAYITGLANGTAYDFRVRAVNRHGLGDVSNTLAASPYTRPDAPRSLTADPGDQQITLTWQAPASDGGSPVAGYSLRSRIAGTSEWGPVQELGTGLDTTVSDLVNGTGYEFQVAARNAAGTGDWSDTSPASTPRTTPGGPANLAAVPGDGQLELSWSAPTNTGGAPVTGYEIQEQTASGGWVDHGSIPDSTITLTGLVNGQSYLFRIAAVNAAGHGPWAEFEPVTPRTTPSTPRSLTADPGDELITLKWETPASDGGSPVTGYSLRSRIAGTSEWGPVQELGTGLDTTVSDLVNGTGYEFQVAAVNAAGHGPWAEFDSVTPRRTASTPLEVTATPADGTVVLGWKAPANDGGAPVTGYVIEQSSSLSGSWESATDATFDGTTAQIDGLANGTAYRFRVSALTVAGVGAWSDVVVATPFVFQPQFTGPDGGPLVDATLHRGDRIALRSDRLPVGAAIAVELHSDPVELGRGVVNADGSVVISMTVPVNTEYGSHELVATLTDAGASVAPASVRFSVVATPTKPGPEPGGDTDPPPATPDPGPTSHALPSTGGQPPAGLLAIAALLLAGVSGARWAARRAATGPGDTV